MDSIKQNNLGIQAEFLLKISIYNKYILSILQKWEFLKNGRHFGPAFSILPFFVIINY